MTAGVRAVGLAVGPLDAGLTARIRLGRGDPGVEPAAGARLARLADGGSARFAS
ncbi:MAG: hypothetical protein ACYC65_02920 [Candidatus Limnocylindrales bacterium]